MSETVLYGIDKDWDLIELGEYRNSHLGARTIWDSLSRHIGWNGIAFGSSEEEMKKFWSLWKLPTVPTFEKIVMLSTFDNVWVKKKNINKLVNAFKEYINTLTDVSTHLPKYIEDIQAASDLNGLCWYISSIGEDPWFEWNEEDDQVGYDFKSGDKHWELFEYLNEFKFEEVT
jgi:hypothetical protein